jgi:hypothetical protein
MPGVLAPADDDSPGFVVNPRMPSAAAWSMVEQWPAALVVDPLVAVVLVEWLGGGDVELAGDVDPAGVVAGAALLAVDPAAEQAVRLRAAVSTLTA